MIEQHQVWYGGDYCPEQWDRETVLQDMVYFKEAGVNLVTLPVFAWAKLEPEEGVYDFAWLDDILAILQENGIAVCMATSTVSQPAWLSAKYPDVLPVDIAGRKRTHGMRVFFCVNSPTYRKRAAALAEAMAKRYAAYPGLVAWHVANEYGTYCYCPTCEKKFRQWLQARYGTIEELNRRWYTAFWGRQVYTFEEIMLPTERNDDYRFNPIVQLDYMRFVTDSTVECYRNEADIIRRHSPGVPVFSNISGFIKKLDQFKMNKDMDFVGWDNYPGPRDDSSLPALKHDIMRGLKGGKPYWVVEQSPNQQNWQPYNKLKRPGEVRRLAYQGIARGADACLYFQMRQARGGQEKYHGALISHAGHNNTRIFREMAALGGELQTLGDRFVNGRVQTDVGFLFDWDNWWALELSSGPSADLDYLAQVHHYYKPFYHANLTVDILNTAASLEDYRLIVAPLLYMHQPGVAEKLAAFVQGGGILVATYLSGHVDQDNQCGFGAYPGALREVLGLWVEESDALFPDERNSMLVDTAKLPLGTSYRCDFLCDVVRLEGAEVLATYGSDFYAGAPCVTRNRYGKGEAYYLAARPDGDFLDSFVGWLAGNAGITAPLPATSQVELVCRGPAIFAINHGQSPGSIDLGAGQYRCALTGEALSGCVPVDAGDVRVFLAQ